MIKQLKTIATVVAVAIVVTLPSCRQKTVSVDEPIALTGEKCQLDSQFMGSVFPMYNGEFFVMHTWLPDEALYIARVDGLDFKTDSLRLPIGDGPKEFRRAIPLLLDSTLLVVNNIMGHMESFTVIPFNTGDYADSDTWTRYPLGKLDNMRSPTVSFVALSDSTILAISSDFFSANTFSIINFKNQTATELDWTPDDGFTGPEIAKGFVYADNSNLFRSGDRFFYICGEGRFAFIFTLEDGNMRIEKTLFDDFPQYKATPDGINYRLTKREGVTYSPAATDNYIYLLEQYLDADGETPKPGYPRVNGTKVLVYDWDGNKVAVYEVDRMGESIFVSPDDKYLFVRSHDDDDYDKTVIMRYTLP